MARFACPYLQGEVELTDERERHISEQHPDLLPQYRERLIETLAYPDEVRISSRFGHARLFSRWYENLRQGKRVVVVVVSALVIEERHWIITAYLARKLSGGQLEWKRN